MLRYVSPVAATFASFSSFAGVDLHKDTLTVCLINPASGEIQFQKLACKCREQIAEYFRALPRPCVVAIETVGFYRWLWDLLEPIVDKLLLADATASRKLAGRRIKTDREDANNICGPPDVRWVLQQASWTAIRSDPAIKKLWRNIAKRAGSKPAAVAVARHMLMWMWSMNLHQTPFKRKEAA